jgi:selenide,water dikinase
VHPDHVVGHHGARPGDVLFLTKPLGTGLVTTAIKRGLCPPELEREAIGVMSTLNRAASEAMLGAHATAATDVTGYGLIGHVANLAGGADILFSAVPFMHGVRELAEADLFPGGSRRNHEALRDRVEWGGLGEMEQLMLCDAQTSGGLLVAIPPEHAEGFPGARIGVMRADGRIRVG